jgi:hypothetical protein
LDQTAIIYLLVIIFIAEHGYWVIDHMVGKLSQSTKTKGEVTVMKEEYVVRRKYFGDMGLVGDHSSEGNTIREHGTTVSDGAPPSFWKEKDVENIVHHGKEMLSRGWKGEKMSRASF